MGFIGCQPEVVNVNPRHQTLALQNEKAPSLDANLELVYLFLETNELTALPSLPPGGCRVLRVWDSGGLDVRV